MGFSPFRAFPSHAAAAPSGAHCPLVVTTAAEATDARLQGLHPRGSPLDLLGVFTEANPDALLGLLPLQGIHPSRRGTAFAAPPLQGRVLFACKHDRSNGWA
jgi:hypothetical protein